MKLSDPETNDNFLDVAFFQLEVAYHFDVWQQVFSIMKQINSLMNERNTKKKAMSKRLMLKYNDNLAKVFWKSKYYHFFTIAHYQPL